MTKNLRLFAFFILSLGALLLLSGCTGSGLTNSWPGVTVSEDGQTAYISNNAHVYVVNLTSGTEQWRFPQSVEKNVVFYAPVAVGEDGQVLAASYDFKLYSINPSGATQNWVATNSTSRYIAGPLSDGDLILAPSSDSNLYAFDQQGTLQWTFTAQHELWSTPVVNKDTIYLAGMDHHVYALKRSTGEMLWQTEDLGGAMADTPTFNPDGKLYVGTYASELIALDAATGDVLWEVPAGGWIWSSPLLRDGVLYYGSLAGEVFAVDAVSGSIKWRIQPATGPNQAVVGRPALIGTTLYYATQAGILYAVDVASGAPLWNKQLQGQILANLQVSGDTLLVAPMAVDPILLALDPSGNQKWAFVPAK